MAKGKFRPNFHVIFIFQNFDKQIASCDSTCRELSFEWSHHRISSADSKVRVALQNSIKFSGSEGVKGVENRMKDCFKCLIYIEEEEVDNFLEFLRLDIYK